jgi:hypothetical protein
MSLTHPGLCEICGERSTVRAAVVAWRNPMFGRYDAVDRCLDEKACRERIESRGDEWPVLATGERVKA